MRTLLWFRGKDLRLSDHGPLRDAVDAGDVIPLFVLDPYFFEPTRAAQLPPPPPPSASSRAPPPKPPPPPPGVPPSPLPAL